MLAEKGLALDAVIELKVDEGKMLKRIENRIAEMTARGEPLRADDNPETLKKRIDAYRAQTAPLIDYYAGKGALKTVDGMAPIEKVSAAIAALLDQDSDGAAAIPAPRRPAVPRTAAARKAAPRPSARKPAGRVAAGHAGALGRAAKPTAAAGGKAKSSANKASAGKSPAKAAATAKAGTKMGAKAGSKKGAKVAVKVAAKRGGKPAARLGKAGRGKTRPGAKKPGRRG
jgi:adenylate kinase